MKVSYCDESGTGDEPIAVMVGVIVNAQRINGVGPQLPHNMVRRWLSHAELSTTVIYADAVGAEAKQIAQRMLG